MECALAVEVATSKRSHRFFYLIFIFLFLLSAAVVTYLKSPLSVVKSIQISGTIDVPASLVARDLGIQVGDNLWQISTATAEHRILSDFPIVQSVDVTRSFVTQTVRVVITQKRLVGILDANHTFYQILSDGTVLTQDPTGIGANAPILSVTGNLSVSPGMRVTNPGLLALCHTIENVPAGLISPFSEFNVEPYLGKLAIVGYTKDHFEVLLPIDRLAAALQMFEAIHAKLLSSKVAPGLIDLISSQEGVYKPY